MSNEQAQAAVGPAFARPVRLVYGDRAWTLRPASFGSRVTISDGVLRALGAKAGSEVSLVPEVDTQEVRRFVGALDKRVSVRGDRCGAQRAQGASSAVHERADGRPGPAPSDRAADRARAPVTADPPNPGRRQDAAARANGCALRPGDRHSPRCQPAAVLPGRAFGAAVRSRDRPGDLSDTDRNLQHRGHAEEPVVAATRLGVGEGGEADPARARGTRSARVGWVCPPRA